MSQFRGILSTSGLGSLINVTAAPPASDYTPNAVNWSNITYDCISGIFTASERQITGINQTITLRVTNPTGLDGVYYYVSNTAGDIVSGDGDVPCIDPGSCGMTWLPHNSTFTVSNNQYVTFAGSGSQDFYQNSVINTSDGNALLDTFTYSSLNCF